MAAGGIVFGDLYVLRLRRLDMKNYLLVFTERPMNVQSGFV